MRSFKLTKKLARKEALNYPSVIKFKSSDPNLYKLAKQKGWLPSICSHMKDNPHSRKKVRTKWFYESCKKEAKNHFKRVLFKKNARGCYDVCERNGWLYEFCQHMVSPMDLRERKLQYSLLKKIKKKYPDLLIESEYLIPLTSKKTGRIDFLITNILTKKSIAFELKHSKSIWTKPELSFQKRSYIKAFKNRKKFKGVFFLCDTEKYGIPVNQIDSLINLIY